MQIQRWVFIGSVGAVVALAACGGGEKNPAAETGAAKPSQTAQPAAGAEQTPDPGKKVIAVTMITDEKSSRFEPNEIQAEKGDVIRYTLQVGVHNVHFLPDSNKTMTGLPAAPSDMLQLPGQTYDVKVSSAPGTYYFQCDPHAALGMKGHLTVK